MPDFLSKAHLKSLIDCKMCLFCVCKIFWLSAYFSLKNMLMGVPCRSQCSRILFSR